MPAEEGIGRDQGVPVAAYPSPEARGLGGPAPALGVGEPETARTELLSADAMLFLERVNDVTRLLVDPARDGHDEELQHVGNRRQTGRAEQRLSAVTNVATRRASSVESARRTTSIGFLDSTRTMAKRTAGRGRAFLEKGQRVLGYVVAVFVGFALMVIGLGLGVTMIMLPVGLGVGLIGALLFVWGLVGHLENDR